jgi:hypothetical protein
MCVVSMIKKKSYRRTNGEEVAGFLHKRRDGVDGLHQVVYLTLVIVGAELCVGPDLRHLHTRDNENLASISCRGISRRLTHRDIDNPYKGMRGKLFHSREVILILEE